MKKSVYVQLYIFRSVARLSINDVVCIFYWKQKICIFHLLYSDGTNQNALPDLSPLLYSCGGVTINCSSIFALFFNCSLKKEFLAENDHDRLHSLTPWHHLFEWNSAQDTEANLQVVYFDLGSMMLKDINHSIAGSVINPAEWREVDHLLNYRRVIAGRKKGRHSAVKGTIIVNIIHLGINVLMRIIAFLTHTHRYHNTFQHVSVIYQIYGLETERSSLSNCFTA